MSTLLAIDVILVLTVFIQFIQCPTVLDPVLATITALASWYSVDAISGILHIFVDTFPDDSNNTLVESFAKKM